MSHAPIANRGARTPPTPRPAVQETHDSLAEAADALFEALAPEHRRAAIEKRAANFARMVAAAEVGDALKDSGKTLRQIQEETGLDPATVSRVVTGFHENGPRLSTIATIAFALGKKLTLKIE